MARDTYEELAVEATDPYSQLGDEAPRDSGIGRFGRQVTDWATLGFGNIAQDWIQAAAQTGRVSGPEFDAALARQRRLTEASRHDVPGAGGGQWLADTAARTVGGVLGVIPTAGRNLYQQIAGRVPTMAPAGQAAAELSAPAIEAFQNLLPRASVVGGVHVPLTAGQARRQAIGEGVRTGAVYGAAGAVGQAPPGATTSNVLQRMGEFGLGGALLGGTIPLAAEGVSRVISAPGDISRWLLAGPRARIAERAEPWREAGLAEQPAVTLIRPGLQPSARRLTRTILGGRTREDIAAGTGQVEAAAGEALRFGGAPRTVSEAGEEAQALIQRGLTRQRSTEEIAAMTPEELARVSGVGEPATAVPRVLRAPTEADIEARARQYTTATASRPVDPAQVPMSTSEAARLARAEKVVQLYGHQQGVIERMRAGLREAMRQRDAIAREVQAARDVGMPPSAVQGVRGDRRSLTSRLVQAEAEVARQQRRLNSMGLIAAQRRLETLRAEIAANAERIAAENTAREASEFAANLARGRIRARVELQAEYRQARAQEDARAASMGLPASTESFATQLAAGERALAARMPSTQEPLLTPSGTPTAEASALGRVLNQIALRARGAGLLPGYRPELLFSREGLFPGLAAYLNHEIGPRATQILNTIAMQRPLSGTGRFAQGIAGSQEIAGLLGAARNKEVAALLSNAVQQDIERIASRTAAGTEWLRAITEFRRIREQIARQLEDPLRQVSGSSNPAIALNMLQDSMRRNGDINVLRAFLQLADAKGDRGHAVSLLLTNMTEGGLQGYLRNWRALTPEARQLLFSGSYGALGARLERLAAVGATLERVAPGGQRLGNIAAARDWLALLGLAHLMPSSLTAAVGAKAADMVLGSRAFSRWLLRQPIRTSRRNRAQSIAALAAIPAGAVGLQPEAWERAKRAIIAPAEAAGPAIPVAASRPETPANPFGGLPDSEATIRTFEPDDTAAGRIVDPEAQPDGFVSPELLEAVPQPASATEADNPIFRMLRGVRDAFIPSAEASVIGPIGARALRAAGRPLAERLITMAERLQARGVPDEEIIARASRLAAQHDPLLGTLTEVAPGQWGVEISNEAATVRVPHRVERVLPLRDVLRDPELEQAYPRMSVDVIHAPEFTASAHIPPGYSGRERPGIVLGRSRDPRGTMLHEVEHEVQRLEEFPSGANLAMFDPDGPLFALRLPGETRLQAYQRVSGEWYAREAAERAEWPANLRRDTPLERPEDLMVLNLDDVAEHRPLSWTPERMKQVADLRREGLNAVQIAKHLGSTPWAVRSAIAQYGEAVGILPSLGGRPRTKPVTVSTPRPSRLVRAFGSEENAQRFAQMWNSGVPRREIARELGWDILRVENFSRRYRQILNLRPRTAESKRIESINPEYRQAVLELVKRQTPTRRGERMENYRAIARRFGLHHKTPAAAAARLGGITAEIRKPTRSERVRATDNMLDKRAMSLEQQFIATEDALARRGLNPSQIAEELNRIMGTRITEEDIRTGNVWWRLGEARESEFGAGSVEFDPRTMGGWSDPLAEAGD